MKGNRRSDTRPEKLLRSELHKRGMRFRKDLPIDVGESRHPRPDIVFTRRKVAVFLDGCFWHLCPVHGRIPGGKNSSYWKAKLEGNRERDQRDTELLVRSGWRVVRIWEHELLCDAVDAVEAALKGNGPVK